MNSTQYIYLKIILLMSVTLGQSISYKEGAQFYDNGNIEFCYLSKTDTISGQIFEQGTGVHFMENGIMNWVFLQKDTMIQGHLCRGKGHGFMTSFYPNGQLKIAWLGRNEFIQRIPCAKFKLWKALFAPFHGKTGATTFYENGLLKRCELSESFESDGTYFSKGTILKFDTLGEIIL